MTCFRAVKSFPIETVCLSEQPSSWNLLRRSYDCDETVDEFAENICSQVVLIGNRVVTLSPIQGCVYVYNINTSKFCYEISYGKFSATSVGKIESFDNIAVVGYESGEILLWDLDNPSVYFCSLVDNSNRAHQARVRCLKSTLNEYPIIVSCSDDGTIKVWNLSRFSCETNMKTLRSTILLEKVLQIYKSKMTCCNISPDGTQFVTGSTDGSIRIWENMRECCVLLGHTAPITVVSFYLQGLHFVISGSTDETIRLWDYSSGNCVLLLSSLQIPRDFIFIEKNLLLTLTTSLGGFLWNLFHGQCLAQITFHAPNSSSMKNSTFHEKDRNAETSYNDTQQTYFPICDTVSLYYNHEKHEVYVPIPDGSVIAWNCYSFLQKWKGFTPLKELLEVGTVLAKQVPQMTYSSTEIENASQHCDGSLPLETLKSQNSNKELVLRWREERLNAEKQSIEQQRKELELWAKNLEETKEALENLYNRRVENLERRSQIINDLYEQISVKSSSNDLLPPLHTIANYKS
ncbi:WD repeat-containing protein tag-125 [Galdieria sulphuraria]|uniref:Transducin family protein / WD-40 repeat family protein n=1 Tax=Galdieria sulphuraria TaxID=130081 RepID=M2XI61_GALSU|nr:transducin family protein / WD-40 repeat family protein [Galdieria sulphuraria]EME29777.1 transducin family protein / WD-40 repeat family protein [Galdieria sulphuraria]GJD06764.1 WD repeat-containing protein tag-125 [Galdieria sulphuraria]|eukprot:XP_005706297.1 transducin family protein / WD-40 repeat family protein [Galdieria sulphuraria]